MLCTCPDTFAPSYSAEAIQIPPSAPNHIPTPVAIETSGVLGPASKVFIRELGYTGRTRLLEIQTFPTFC